jgi:hypothetical protein
MGTLALPGYDLHRRKVFSVTDLFEKKRYHAAIRSKTSPGHHTLSANVEIGVPRSESQGLSGFPKALFVRDYLKMPCRIEALIIS